MGEIQMLFISFIRQPNDIMILGLALLFYGTCQLLRKAS
jgi:hypothetical protein